MIFVGHAYNIMVGLNVWLVIGVHQFCDTLSHTMVIRDYVFHSLVEEADDSFWHQRCFVFSCSFNDFISTALPRNRVQQMLPFLMLTLPTLI